MFGFEFDCLLRDQGVIRICGQGGYLKFGGMVADHFDCLGADAAGATEYGHTLHCSNYVVQNGLMRFDVYSGEELIGWSELPVADPPMGVAQGELFPTPAYERVRPIVRRNTELS